VRPRKNRVRPFIVIAIRKIVMTESRSQIHSMMIVGAATTRLIPRKRIDVERARNLKLALLSF